MHHGFLCVWTETPCLQLTQGDWFIGLLVYLHDQTGYTTNNMYHVESPVDEPPWVTAAAGRLFHNDMMTGNFADFIYVKCPSLDPAIFMVIFRKVIVNCEAQGKGRAKG